MMQDVAVERDLAFSYAPAPSRSALRALWTLDATLAGIIRAARDPLIGEMRLTWWHQALIALDTAPAPAQPALIAIASDVMPAGVTGTALAGMVDGWEALLDPSPLDASRLDLYAQARGGRLFIAAGLVLGAGPGDPLAQAGQGWALADLARHLSTPAEAEAARQAARPLLAAAAGRRWSRCGRALGAMAHSARMDLLSDAKPEGAPSRVARLLRHRLTGG